MCIFAYSKEIDSELKILSPMIAKSNKFSILSLHNNILNLYLAIISAVKKCGDDDLMRGIVTDRQPISVWGWTMLLNRCTGLMKKKLRNHSLQAYIYLYRYK